MKLPMTATFNSNTSIFRRISRRSVACRLHSARSQPNSTALPAEFLSDKKEVIHIDSFSHVRTFVASRVRNSESKDDTPHVTLLLPTALLRARNRGGVEMKADDLVDIISHSQQQQKGCTVYKGHVFSNSESNCVCPWLICCHRCAALTSSGITARPSTPI